MWVKLLNIYRSILVVKRANEKKIKHITIKSNENHLYIISQMASRDE